MLAWFSVCRELQTCIYGPADATVSCLSKIQIGFTILVPVHLVSPRKRAVKRVCLSLREQATNATNKNEEQNIPNQNNKTTIILMSDQ